MHKKEIPRLYLIRGFPFCEIFQQGRDEGVFLLIKLKKKIVFVGLFCILSILAAVLATAVMASSQKVQLPVIMYHSVLKDSARWGDYVISPAELEKDMKFLKDNGYTAIGERELIDYVENGVKLPEKPVILTFDDGYYNNYLYAYPLALKYGMKIIISPIGYWSQQYSKDEKLSAYYSHCTWEQIEEMYNSGLVEFANHTYNLHKNDGSRKGSKRLPGESEKDYKELLTNDIDSLQKKLYEVTGNIPKTFTYPFGAISEEEPELIHEMGFKVSFSCETKMNTITREPESLQLLGRLLRTDKIPVSKLLKNN